MTAASFAGADDRPEACPEASPFWSSIRSLAFPGWGQLHNGSEIRAAVLFSMQTYFLSRIYVADRRASYYRDRANDPEPAWDRDELLARYDDLRDTRGDMVWWSAILALYSVIDAYVDAHMVGFDEGVDEVERLTWTVTPREGGAAVGIRAVW